jgi:hypothetical protein
MLSFQIDKSSREIQIDCDARGMATLLGTLAHLVGERSSHRHLWGPDSGGKDLDEKTPSGEEAVTSVIINYAEGD